MTGKRKQKLIIIRGSPCVGKTTVAKKLFESYEMTDCKLSLDKTVW